MGSVDYGEADRTAGGSVIGARPVPRRKKSVLDPAEAHLFTMQTAHEEVSKLLLIIEEICLRFPPNDELIFVRYLLRMVELETRSSMTTDS